VGAELFHAKGEIDGQTDMTKLIIAFGNFANAPEKIWDYLNGGDHFGRASIS
jgi:hypothetical protein